MNEKLRAEFNQWALDGRSAQSASQHLGFVEEMIQRMNVRPREGKYEIVGSALDGRRVGLVCRVTLGQKVRVITVCEDRPKQ